MLDFVFVLMCFDGFQRHWHSIGLHGSQIEHIDTTVWCDVSADVFLRQR